jgi:cation-transporting ATPase 13A3/4/5
MADPPASSSSNFPADISASQPINRDNFHPEPRPASKDQDGQDAGPSNYDYTENAPQAVVDAIAIERAREEKEGPGEMMVGSFSSWAGTMDGAPGPRVRC